MGLDRHGLGGSHKGLSVTTLSKEELKQVMDIFIKAHEMGKQQSHATKLPENDADFLCIY